MILKLTLEILIPACLQTLKSAVNRATLNTLHMERPTWLIYSMSVLQILFTESILHFMQYVVFSQQWEVGFVCLKGYTWIHKISCL